MGADAGADVSNDAARPRLEAVAKVTGRARYSADMHVAGQLEAGFLRSTRPHARIRSIDVEQARALPGVHAVLTGEDLAEMRWYDEQTPILTDVARFVGDELAVVAAESGSVLDEALRLLHVDDEPWPIHADLGDPEPYQRGDVEAAFARAPHTVTATYSTPVQVHHALESHGAQVSWDGETLTAHVSTQSVHDVRAGLAEALGLRESQVRVIAEHVGGGFGAKQIVWKPTVLCAVLAMRTGRPVRLMLDRHGEALAAGHRNSTRQTVRLAADDDGRLTAIDVDIVVAAGAYTLGGESSSVEGPFQYLYRCANVRTVKTTARTHLGPAVAFRAPGYVEGAFALESAMDELARTLKIDPVELRLRNAPHLDQVRDRPLSSPDALETCCARAAEVFGWAPAAERPDSDDGSDGARVRRGFGFAAHDWVGGKGNPPAYARVAFAPDGSVQLVTGTQDIGTGTRTVLAQIAAETLGVDVASVVHSLGDTAHGLHAPVSSGSATVPTLGPAVHDAAARARHELLVAASLHLGVTVDELEWTGSEFRQPDGTVTPLPELLEAIQPKRIIGNGARERLPDGVTIRTYGAVCAEVVVDLDVGSVEVVRIVCAPDCGRIVNPLLAESQVIGGVIQGIGFALTEHQVVDDRLGVVLNANLEDYLVPTVADGCEIVHAEVDTADVAANDLGIKGLGELPMIAVAPAITNAIYDATGLRFRDLPITRRRLLDALAELDEAALPTPAMLR